MPKFDFGQVVATPGALKAIRSSGQTPSMFLRRHINGDWGEHLDAYDLKQNQIALRECGRLVSAYQTGKGDDIWITTKTDRSALAKFAFSQ
ncbi:MAG TPA: hypothetical protein VG122_04355 [Gemmata sp.]|jgi:hypothetical protein|nr:hypothetical protein [Gemmata sp.]